MTIKESKQAGAFFHDFAESFDTFYDGKRGLLMQWIDRRWRSDMFTRYALTFQRLGDLTGQCGLDIGCGSGHYIAEAFKRGAAYVVGIDPAPAMLELARRRIEKLGQLDRLTLLEGYFPEQVPAGFFDFAIVMGVLDYCADPVTFFKGLRPILRGKAAVSFPSQHWLRTPVRKLRYRVRNCPVYFYDERRIRSICAQAGFAAVDLIKIDGAGMDYHVCLSP
jgi:SAM-dependent methyltransferase